MLVCYDFSFFSHDAKVVEVFLCGNIFVVFLLFSLMNGLFTEDVKQGAQKVKEEVKEGYEEVKKKVAD